VDVAFVTERRFESPGVGNQQVTNVLEEDRLIVAALARHGLTSQRVDWSRSDVDWSRFRCALFRHPWDYFERFPQFCAWLERVAGATRFFNPLPVVHWNLDKHYLAELEARGIPVVPTRFVEARAQIPLDVVLRAASWDEAVIKPAVSGAGRHTYRVRRGATAELEPQWQQLVAGQAMMVQPFQRRILAEGEITLVVIDGQCSHAVRKVARPGEFRVQDDHGGTVHDHRPEPDEVALAERAIAAAGPEALLYGRVDLVRDNAGALAVMELELIEPELWMRRCPAAAQRLADGLVRRLG
jgi:glutathione synthase/RimK-type ligase-like ATP-grasp enzyme